MNKLEYLLYAKNKGYHLVYKWYLELFGIHHKDVEYEYIVVKNGIKYYRVDNDLIETSTSKYSPMLDIKDVIKLKAYDVANLKEDIFTSVGLFIANTLFLEYPFGDKIPYINSYFTHKNIEKQLPKYLKEKYITVEEYRKYVDSVSFSLNINKLFAYSNTKKTVTPAPGIEEFKKQLIEKYFKTYGLEWKDNDSLAIQFIKELQKYDLDYIKDDPSYGKLLSGKIVNNSRPRMFMAFGVETGFDTTGSNSKFIINSLLEGYPKDKAELAMMFNSARMGSYGRGAETQQGGSLVKEMQRASNSLVIKEGDCNTKRGLPIYVDKLALERYKNVYVLQNGKSVKYETLESFKDKTIEIRNTMYCNYKDSYCEICAGEDLKDYTNGISLLIVESGGIVLNLKMKGMHKASKQTLNFNIIESIK